MKSNEFEITLINAGEDVEITMEYKFVHFVKLYDKLKTSVWSCRNNKSKDELGIVKWHAPWRAYCYFPNVQAVYSSGCLADIQDFILSQMKARSD